MQTVIYAIHFIHFVEITSSISCQCS